jgi:AcrR family transcriptional regulator
VPKSFSLATGSLKLCGCDRDRSCIRVEQLYKSFVNGSAGSETLRNSGNTRTAILDAAENLFAAASFDIVSMRDVAAKARVPLGLINYHFQSKEKLFEAIIARRSDELNARRRTAFAQLKGNPDIRQVIDVFLRPYLELMLEGGPGWRSYGRLLAQTGQQQRWTRLITRHFKETQDIVLGALERAEPRLSKEAAARGYTHMVSIMFGMFAANDLLGVISRRAYSSRDLQRAYDFALPFLAGAFEGLAASAACDADRERAAHA